MVAASSFQRVHAEFKSSPVHANRIQCRSAAKPPLITADIVASPPLPRSYLHRPSGTKTSNRHRDCRQHSFRYRGNWTLRNHGSMCRRMARNYWCLLFFWICLRFMARSTMATSRRVDELPFKLKMPLQSLSTRFCGSLMLILANPG